MNDNYSNNNFIEKERGGKSKDVLVSLLIGKNNPLIISLLIAGIAFMLIGVVGWEVAKVLETTLSPNDFSILQIVAYVGIFVPIIGSFFVYKRVNTIKSFWLVLMILTYVIAELISFSLVFIVHNVKVDWILAFGFSGGMFVLCGIIGYFCTWIKKLWKYVAFVSFIWIILIIVMVVVRFTVPNSGIGEDLYLISAGVLGFLTLFYIMFDVHRMKNFLADSNNVRGTVNMILLTAFRFLIDLVNLVWVFARLTFLNK